MIGSLNGVLTLILIILFLGIWIWAWSAKHKENFEKMAQLPLEKETAETEAADDE